MAKTTRIYKIVSHVTWARITDREKEKQQMSVSRDIPPVFDLGRTLLQQRQLRDCILHSPGKTLITRARDLLIDDQNQIPSLDVVCALTPLPTSNKAG